MTLMDVIKMDKPFKRKDDPCWFYPNNNYAFCKEDILANDWECQGEIWIEILDFNLCYKISNYGNLYSYRMNKLLTPKINKYGYLEVTLRNKEGKQQSKLIHHLVVKYFMNYITKKLGLVINHKDGNKLNNKLENLEIVTRSRNSKHAYEIGLNKPRLGEKSNLSKLKYKEVQQIKNMLKSGYSSKEIAHKFNIHATTISKIKTGKTWKTCLI